jgi:hypothetical protein
MSIQDIADDLYQFVVLACIHMLAHVTPPSPFGASSIITSLSEMTAMPWRNLCKRLACHGFPSSSPHIFDLGIVQDVQNISTLKEYAVHVAIGNCGLGN